MTVCWPMLAFNMCRYAVLLQTDLVQDINFELASWLPNDETGSVVAYVLGL